MATLTSIVKDGLHLVFTYDDGTVVRRSIVLDNTVVSEPLDGYEEVGNIYVNHSAGTLIVNYNGESITLGADGNGYTDAEAIAAAKTALDYGLSFEGVITTFTDSTHFRVSTLADKGTGFFKPAAGMPYEIYVVEADGAAPEGEQTPVVAYTTADGGFEHAAFTANLAVGDIVLIIHPLLATLGTKATPAASGAVTTTDYFMAYIKQAITLLLLIPTTAMRGTDSAALASAWTAALATALGNYTAARAAFLDNIDNANLATIADISALNATRIGYLDQLDFALQEAIAAIPTTAMRGTDNAALASAWTAALATALGNYNATRAGYLDELDFALQEAIAAIPTTAMRGTDNAALASAWTAALATILGNFSAARIGYLDELAAANLPTDVAAIITDLASAVPEPPTAKSLQDILHKDTNYTYSKATDSLEALADAIAAISAVSLSSDWKGNFNWDTSAYTTVEQDISALFSTNLALATRRKYSVKLDLTAVEADGSFVELYLAVWEKIDGTNYRAIDRKTVTKANIATTAEPGIVIDIPATSENIKITMQMSAALAGDATIYYAVVKEHLE